MVHSIYGLSAETGSKGNSYSINYAGRFLEVNCSLVDISMRLLSFCIAHEPATTRWDLTDCANLH